MGAKSKEQAVARVRRSGDCLTRKTLGMAMVMVNESWRGCGMNGGRLIKVEAAFLAMIDWEGSPGYGSSFSCSHMLEVVHYR